MVAKAARISDSGAAGPPAEFQRAAGGWYIELLQERKKPGPHFGWPENANLTLFLTLMSEVPSVRVRNFAWAATSVERTEDRK
jgi:hypothetical protein